MAESFEAKLHGFRRTQDGIVISYVVHPNDLSAAMALAPLGTRYMVAFAEIGDDGQPVAVPAQKPEAKESKPFASLPLSQQAAIRCQDNDFKLFLSASNAEQAAEAVRERCGVPSRSALVEGTPAGTEWAMLERDYQAWLTDQRFADVRR